MKIGSIVIRSYEFDKMLAFWQQALHYVPREPATSGSGRSSRPSGEGAEPVFEPRFERNVPASEADCTSTCTQQSRGGSRTFNQRWGDPRYPWRYKPGRDFVVLQDPSGNLFCVVEKADG